ncbi:hypothetical protein [Kitasatospora sp. NPDC001683]
MTPSLALAATVTGTLVTLAPIDPAAVREAHRLIDPDAPMWMDPEIADLLAQIDELAQPARIDRSWLEDKLLVAYGVPARDRLAEARDLAGELAQTAREILGHSAKVTVLGPEVFIAYPSTTAGGSGHAMAALWDEGVRRLGLPSAVVTVEDGDRYGVGLCGEITVTLCATGWAVPA